MIHAPRGVAGLSLLILMLAVPSACAGLRRPMPPVDRSQDARILAEVERRLTGESSIDAERIRVEVDGAIVILYGGVSGIDQWQCAIRTAQLVPGVRTVVDYLVIERGPRRPACRPHGADVSLPRNVQRVGPRAVQTGNG